MKKGLTFLMLLTIVLGLIGCEDNKETGKTPVKPEPEVEYVYSTYTNPVSVIYENGSDFKAEVADPSIVRGDDGLFYIFATGGVVLKSEDACNWVVHATKVLPSMPTWDVDVWGYGVNPGIWAPDVIKIGDKWIYYYSLSAWGKCCGIGLAVADEITGPYEDLGKLFDYKEIGIDNAIDPHVFVEDDGTVYMSVGSFQGLYLLQLTSDGLELEGGVETQARDKVLIAGKVGGWDGSTYEGSYIIKKDGYYYYFGSAGTCCEGKNSTYRVLVGRAEEITGPYLDAQGRPLTASGSGKTFGTMCLDTGITNKNMSGAGHNSILVDDAGDYWIYYHAYSTADNYATRHLFMDKLAWDENGFPYVSYTYTNDEGEEKTSKIKPSFQIELDGPRFIA
jgi:arabinan endo-1,5-alpha-L-arabinosidase